MRNTNVVKNVKKVVVVLVVICVLAFASWIGYKVVLSWHNNEQDKAVSEALEKEEKKVAVLMKYNKAISNVPTIWDKIEEKIAEEEYVFDAGSIETEINELSELTTVEYLYTNYGSVKSEKNFELTGWKVPFSSKELTIVMDGSLKIGVDCSKIELDVDESTKTITIKVPSAKILSNELFEDTLVVCEEDDSLFSEITDEDSSYARQEIKSKAEDDAEDSGMFEQAEEKAAEEVERLLVSIPEVSANYTIVVA
ncbi:MAG: DUF4230 domain-containing protein [Clostridia bacterium]|nr:DUF4230 domain-containing protein [Clostridia bacterium]